MSRWPPPLPSFAPPSRPVSYLTEESQQLTPPSQQDKLTGDEIISDSFDLKEVDGVAYEADCAMITLGAVNVGAYTPSRTTELARR